MSVQFKYGDNYIHFNNIVISREQERNGNPYNTSFDVRVRSGVFQGEGQFECDVKELIQFISELKQLYQFEIGEVGFQEIGYGCTITFKMDHRGHITVRGNIFDRGMSQELKYEFEANQTVLLPFIESLESYVKGIKLKDEDEKKKLFDRLVRWRAGS